MLQLDTNSGFHELFLNCIIYVFPIQMMLASQSLYTKQLLLINITKLYDDLFNGEILCFLSLGYLFVVF